MYVREPTLVREGLPTHLAGELLSVSVQQVLELHVSRGRGPAGRLLVLHLPHTVGKGQGLRGVVLLAQPLRLRLHLCHHVLVVAGYLGRSDISIPVRTEAVCACVRVYLVDVLVGQLFQDGLLDVQRRAGRLVQHLIG